MSIKQEYAEQKYEEFVEKAYLTNSCRGIYEHSIEELKLEIGLDGYICSQDIEKELSTELVKL